MTAALLFLSPLLGILGTMVVSIAIVTRVLALDPVPIMIGAFGLSFVTFLFVRLIGDRSLVRRSVVPLAAVVSAQLSISYLLSAAAPAAVRSGDRSASFQALTYGMETGLTAASAALLVMVGVELALGIFGAGKDLRLFIPAVRVMSSLVVLLIGFRVLAGG